MIVVICGPPGAGKTTVAERAHERLADRGIDLRLLHSDEFSRRTYERIYERVEGSDDDWLLDGTFYDATWQERFRALGARFVLVTASLETCLERNRARPEPIDEAGVRTLHHEFHDPRPDLRLDTDEVGVDEAVDRVVAAVESWYGSA